MAEKPWEAMTIEERRNLWWCVIAYEVTMLRWAISAQPLDVLAKNFITENKILHARNLCDFCTSTRKNDIKPADLFDSFDDDLKYTKLRELLRSLSRQYGNGREGDVKWTFNKMLAHPTKERGKNFDYTTFLDRISPVLGEIIAEIESLRERPF